MSSYCYVGRYNRDKVYVNENVDQIFNSVVQWVEDKPWPKIPNQQDDTYYLADIACSTDIPLKQKYINLEDILKQYDNHPKLKSTFATKYPSLLNLDVTHFNKKPRVRVSLMPQEYSDILEPNTDNIIDRISCIDKLQELGWEVHINFSPVILHKDWLMHYTHLFNMCNQFITNKQEVKCEVIFMTSSPLMQPSEKASKLMSYVSEYKTPTVQRYPLRIKRKAIEQFKELHQEMIPWCDIRYIF